MTVTPVAEHTSLQEWLRRLRAEYGLSYQQLSERSCVDVAYLHRIETGKAHRPSRDILIRIALGLGLEIETADSLVRAGGHVPLLPAGDRAPPPGGR
jgi:transcriptional regulator with XRE-family HTH domain